MVKAGDTAPNFELPDQDGNIVRLSDLRGQIVVLYFYPRDETPGCTAEACSFRDSFHVFKTAGARVIGVSSDSVDTHKKFATNHGLPFTLLSDENQAIRQAYGVGSTLFLIPGRVTYVIDKSGIVRYTFSSQFNAAKHVQEALKVVQQLS
ncbi:alkyl hydroperoxide reductase [Pelomyxa schiedti]|nr:alkyl hydroperoxide reductase [Pelomyxa schiedti]